jgi:hypothetical protein
MISNHAHFTQAVRDLKKVWIKYYSEADSGVLELICAPLSYGPGGGSGDGLNRYWLWDYDSGRSLHTLGLLPQQIVELTLLGETFDPSVLVETPPPQKAATDPGTNPNPVVVAGDQPAEGHGTAPLNPT